MQKVQDNQEDLAWGRRYFVDATADEQLMLAVYLNVVKGFFSSGMSGHV